MQQIRTESACGTAWLKGSHSTRVSFREEKLWSNGRECLREVAHNSVNIGETLSSLMFMDVGAGTLRGVQDEC